MKYIKLFENFQDNLEDVLADIKDALLMEFELHENDFKIKTKPEFKDKFIVIDIKDISFDKKTVFLDDKKKETFNSLMKHINPNYNVHFCDLNSGSWLIIAIEDLNSLNQQNGTNLTWKKTILMYF